MLNTVFSDNPNMELQEYKQKLKKDKNIYLNVRISPGKSKSKIKDILENKTIKIDISSPPEKGKANKELIKFLSKKFNVPKNNIGIISGKTDRLKLVKIIS